MYESGCPLHPFFNPRKGLESNGSQRVNYVRFVRNWLSEAAMLMTTDAFVRIRAGASFAHVAAEPSPLTSTPRR